MVLQKNKYENHIYNKKFGKEPHSSGWNWIVVKHQHILCIISMPSC
jgi:hypothetical protein